MPGLNTNFSNLLYIFIDEPNNIILGVTSTGDEVAIAMADMVPDATVIVAGAVPVSADLSIIDVALVDDLLFEASGDGVRVAGGSIFQVNDFVLVDIPLGVDIEGECDSVEAIDISEADTLRNAAFDLSQTRGTDDGGVGVIEHFLDETDNTGE